MASAVVLKRNVSQNVREVTIFGKLKKRIRIKIFGDGLRIFPI